MTEADVQDALVGRYRTCLWHPQKFHCARNIKNLTGYEMDLAILQKSGHIWEIEIKVDLVDFRKDKLKEKHELLTTGTVRQVKSSSLRARWYRQAMKNHVIRFYYAVPLPLYNKIMENEGFPAHAGVIAVCPERLICVKKKEAPPLKAEILKEAKAIMNTSAYYLAWRQHEEIRRLKKRLEDSKKKK